MPPQTYSHTGFMPKIATDWRTRPRTCSSGIQLGTKAAPPKLLREAHSAQLLPLSTPGWPPPSCWSPANGTRLCRPAPRATPTPATTHSGNRGGRGWWSSRPPSLERGRTLGRSWLIVPTMSPPKMTPPGTTCSYQPLSLVDSTLSLWLYLSGLIFHIWTIIRSTSNTKGKEDTRAELSSPLWVYQFFPYLMARDNLKAPWDIPCSLLPSPALTPHPPEPLKTPPIRVHHSHTNRRWYHQDIKWQL